MTAVAKFGLFALIGIFTATTVGCASTRKRNRDQAALRLKIGSAYLAQGQYPQAMNELLMADQLDNANPMIKNNLGLVYYMRGKVKTAEEKFRDAIQLNSNYSDAKNNLGRVLIEQKKFAEALRWLHEVEGDLTYGNNEKTYSNLGMAYFEMADFKKAEEYLARSLEIRRENCTAVFFYGRTLYELKRISQSAETLDKAVDYCRPTKFEEPIFYSAMSYFALGNKEKSRARLDELLKDYPKSKFIAKAKGMLGLLEP